MKRNWNLSLGKMLMASVAALLAATSTFAYTKAPTDGRDACPEEPRPGPFAFNYAKDIGLSCPNDFYAFGEFLLMQPQEEGLEYGITQTDTTNQGGSCFPLAGGDVQGFSNGHHDWDFNPGFRVGFGFYLGHDAWNLESKWTYIRIKDDSSSSASNNGIMIPLWLPAFVGPATVGNKDASERWTGKYNTLDFILGKPFHVSRYFIFNPGFGIRAAWIDQDILARYSGSFGNYYNANMTAENDYWGVGIRAGFESEFLLGAGWTLFGTISGSMLYGKFTVTQQLSYGNYGYELDQKFYANNPNLELNMGLSWEQFFCKNKYRIGLRVAYEFINWWKHNKLRRFYDGGTTDNSGATAKIAANEGVANGDLSFNGFSFRLQFDF